MKWKVRVLYLKKMMFYTLSVEVPLY